MTLTQKLVLGFLFAGVLQVAQMAISSYFTAQMQEATQQVADALVANIALQRGVDAAQHLLGRAADDLQSATVAPKTAVYRVYVEELEAQVKEIAAGFDAAQHAPIGVLRQRLDAVHPCFDELVAAVAAKGNEQRREAVAFFDDAIRALNEALLQAQIHVGAFAREGIERERAVRDRPLRASLALTVGGIVLMAAFVGWFSRQLVIPIERAWAELEGRVQERTAELAATVTQLEAQIVERERAEARTKALHEQLVEASRRAGMAELANGVLHNVGNVLNSVNVSANVLLDRLNKSRADGLQKAVDLLRTHSADLGAFLTSSPQGQKLPRYLETLAAHLLDERTALIGETQHLSQRIDHMKEIVNRQQSYARVSGAISPVSLTQIVDDVLSMHSSSFQKHDIRIVRRIEHTGECATDRSRVMQILMNLVDNAKHALCERDRGGALLEVAIVAHGDDRLRIRVTDNGVGIPAENLTKVFAHGFTTKREGHGFGLHHSANSATEIGGRLWAESDGPGRGASFVLELPLQGPEAAVGQTTRDTIPPANAPALTT